MGSLHVFHLMLCMAVAMLLLCLQGPAEAGLRSIWAVDDGEKVFRTNLESTLKSGEGNSVWDGEKVRLFAARNEIVAFQLILEADDEGAAEVNVTVSDLTKGSASIRGSHPLPRPNTYLGVGVELFTEHYLHVGHPSYTDREAGWFNSTSASNPKLTGWMPDALIPFSARPGRGGAPFDISPNTNQGVWGDIYVPKENAPPGLYTGTIHVSAGDTAVVAIPLELQVLDFALPEENHYRSMVFYSSENIAARHGVERGEDLWEMIRHYHRMAHRHRIELIGSGSWQELQALKGTLTGETFTRKGGYVGPGEGVGNTLYSIHTYGVRFPDTEEAYRTESDRWVSWFDDNAPDIEYFLYLIDEPRWSRYAWIQERARWIHDNPGPGSRLPVFVTVRPVYALAGSVDIWCPHNPQYYSVDAEAARHRGDRVWIYAGTRPQTPSDLIDEHGIGFRLKPWIAHRHHIARWFTWESTHWVGNHNEVDAGKPKNVFANPVTFHHEHAEYGASGDGTLFYPGQDRVFPDQDRGYPGPLSSVRMKMYRRGVQDVEYMWLAEQAGRGAEVTALLKERVPAVLWEAEQEPSWSSRNADYERVRRRLADLIQSPSLAPEEE
jgi:hypothetical protein